MHPPAPILNTNALRIQLNFGGLLLLTLSLVWQTAYFFLAQSLYS